jgi:iron-sulfur cluster assembly accessory protein
MGFVILIITPKAVAKIKEIIGNAPALRLGVRGGGCSGFSYAMEIENEVGAMDKTFDFDGLKVLVDGVSLMYLDGVTVDYLETLTESGFKFDNPNVKTTCGCGSSFSVA